VAPRLTCGASDRRSTTGQDHARVQPLVVPQGGGEPLARAQDLSPLRLPHGGVFADPVAGLRHPVGVNQGVEQGLRAGPGQDQWARWLLRERFGGNEQQRDQVLAMLKPIRDRVLAGARVGMSDEVLDVGCGDGLLGLAAADRVGPSGRVSFIDVSAELVGQCRQLAEAAGVADRCDFVVAALPELVGIGDEMADVVVLRSVLIYVPDKAAALRHLHRVLRPGGRLSLFEPINGFGFPEPSGWLWGFDMSGLEPLSTAVHAAYVRHTSRGGPDPMLEFDERDLLQGAQSAGFTDLTLTYEAQIGSRHPSAGSDLSTFLDSAANPTVPTFRQLLDEALTGPDRDLVERRIADQLTAGTGRTRQAVAYLTGRRLPS